jgi:8-amino-7-oxononanoate synthase
MARNLKGRSHVVAIKQSGNIVAYGLNLIGDSEYFGVAEGMDYSIRNKYDLYANNIFEALRVAISLKKKVFNIGITTYDFKTSIGAELEPTIYFLKSFKNPGYTTVFADFIKGAIPQPENKHRAFRTTDITKRMQLNEIKLTVGYGEVTLDPFAKHYSYVRSDAARLADLYTFSPVFESAQEPVIQQSGRNVIMLGTNAYLGLATHPDVIAAATKAVESYGSGCSGSPMLNGTINLHKELAAKLAQFMMKQDALIFSTGYQTNVGVLSALVNRNDVIVMDERSHASLIDGALLSRARIVRYKHNCMVSLEAALEKYTDKPKLIVTDTLFSMEGTIIDLPDIIRLAKKFHARLMLDESHAIGIMGTFSKSLASIGGFVAGDRKLIDTLRHISRAHIFSASLPPAAVATVLAALEIIENDSERRAQVLKNATFLASELQNLGFNISYHGGAILTVHCGHELIAFAAYKKLLGEGVFVNPVTSPAIPKGQEVLRISVMATHTESMLQKALSIFEKIKTPYWPINI